MIRRTLLALALSLLAWSAISVIAEARKPQTHQVVMDAMVFRPTSLTVRQGDTIVWINRDLVLNLHDTGGSERGTLRVSLLDVRAYRSA